MFRSGIFADSTWHVGFYAGCRGERGGHGEGELGVGDGDAGEPIEALQTHLQFSLFVQHDGDRGDLAGGAGGSGDVEEWKAGPVDGLAAQIVHDGALQQGHGGDGAGGVHGASAAEADDEIAGLRPRQLGARVQVVALGSDST